MCKIINLNNAKLALNILINQDGVKDGRRRMVIFCKLCILVIFLPLFFCNTPFQLVWWSVNPSRAPLNNIKEYSTLPVVHAFQHQLYNHENVNWEKTVIGIIKCHLYLFSLASLVSLSASTILSLVWDPTLWTVFFLSE